MAHKGLWPREYNNRVEECGVRGFEIDGLPRKSGRAVALPSTTSAKATTAGGGSNGSYHLGLLLETSVNAADASETEGQREHDVSSSLSSAFDFACSGSGTVTPAAAVTTGGGGRGEGKTKENEESVSFDRVCALRGKVVQIFTFFHPADDSSSGKGTAAAGSPRTTSVSLGLEHTAERAAWNSTASCVAIGDASGRIHFVTGEGTLLFSQPLAKPIHRGSEGSEGQPGIEHPHAFSCIKFSAESSVQTTSASGAEAEAGELESGQELLAVSASMRLYHVTNVPIAAIKAACLAKNVAALKQLRASIRVSIADASEPSSFSSSSFQAEQQQQLQGPETSHPGLEEGSCRAAADACVQRSPRGGGNGSRIFLVSRGAVSVWRRVGGGTARAPGGAPTERIGGTDGGAAAAPSAPAPAPGKLVEVDGVPAGELFGGGGAVSVELSADGRWMIVVDDRGGLSWWDTQSLLRLGRWSWPSGSSFDVSEVVVLPSNNGISGADGGHRGGAAGGGGLLSSGSSSGTHGGGGDARPCLACVSANGEIRVLRLGAAGAEELYRAPGRTVVPGAAKGMLSVPSPSRHQFLLVTSDVPSGKVGFHLGKEAVPRHRLQALLARGEFDRALDLARANSMDEVDVHAARLLALLREGAAGVAPVLTDGALSLTFFEVVRGLLEKLDSPAALGRACEAAVRTPMPSLEDVRKLLEVVENRLRSFEKAGTRVRNLMLERMASNLARLRTFELIEGSRRSALSVSASTPAATAASPLLELGSVAIRQGNSYGNDDGNNAGGGGGGYGPVTRGKENSEEDGEANGSGGGGSCRAEGRDDGADGNGTSAAAPAAASGVVDSVAAKTMLADVSDKEGGGAALSEVARWLQFRTADLVSFVGGALQAGDVQAASVAWRRHGRTDRGVARTAKTAAAAAAGAESAGAGGAGAARNGGAVDGGRRMEVALPGQLATLPAVAPPVLLGAWLRDEVLPWLDVAGVMAVRQWAKHHAREVEALEKRPHGALLFARAVTEGSRRVLGSAAELMSVHSTELAAAEAAVAARTAGPQDHDHWKRWKPDGLDSLERTLDDLAHAWDAHRLQLPLSTFERLPRDVVLFRVLDRVQSPEWLPEEISHHVLPLAKRYGLNPDAVLLDYMRICADTMAAPRCRAKHSSTAASSSSSSTTGGGSVAAGGGGGGGGVGASGLATERRAVAVARCMSSGEGCRSELRSKAVLALANAASFPFSDGLRELVQEALSWGAALDEELRRAATTLTLSQIVQRYHVTGFNLVDASRATRLLRHVLAHVRCPTALDDSLQVAHAYSHLSERDVYVEFLENLAGSYPAHASSTPSLSSPVVAERASEPDADGNDKDRDEDVSTTISVAEGTSRGGIGGGSGGGGGGGGCLAADLATHRARVSGVLRRVPAEDARRVAEEVLLFLVRLLEELELDAFTAGFKPGQLWGCTTVSAADGSGVSSTGSKNGSSNSGGGGRSVASAVVLEPGSDAEQAVLVAAAAAAVVAFLRETSQRGAGGAEKLGNLATMANDLRRVSALQTEFGAFASLKTLGYPQSRACWNMMEEGLVELGEHLHGNHQAGNASGTRNGNGVGKAAAAAPATHGVKKGSRAAGGSREAAARSLPRLLHRAQRLSELLGVAWSSVVSHLAKEAASKGKVPEAVGLCHMLFHRDHAIMDEKAAALALRDTSKALSTFVANQAHVGALRADDQAGAKARTAVLQAMAQSVRGLRQSAALCGQEELPLTMDFLQGSEAVAAVLCRCEGGEELEALMATNFSPSGAAAAPSPSAINGPSGIGNGIGKGGSGSGSSFFQTSQSEWDTGALAGLYKWYPGDGRVLPLEEALKLVSAFVRQELRLRVALVSGDAIAASPSRDEASSAAALAAAAASTDTSMTEVSLSSRWQAGLEDVTSPLLSFLEDMGAQQLCLRVVAGMAVPPPSAVDVLGDAFSGLADKVLEFNHIDCPLSIGYMLAMPMRQAHDTFRRTIRYSSDDYGRMRTLAGVGMYAARAWGNHDLLHQCIEVERDSHWWHVLTSLGIAFDTRGFSRMDRSLPPGEYQKSLVPALLERSGCDLALALEFCDRYGVGEAFPCLLYVDNQLGLPCVSPHDVSYQESISEVLPSVHGALVARMLRHMLDTPGAICDRDYERLAFVHEILLSDKCQEEEEDSEEEIRRLEDSLEALAILKAYTSPWPLDGDGMPIDAAADGGGGGSTAASSSSALLTFGVAAANDSEVYARRVPFMALVRDPWAVLEAQLRADSVAKLVPLADPLGLGVGEFYARLVTGMLSTGTGGNHTPSPGPVPTFSALQPWLDKIKDPALACMTAQRVAAGMARNEDRLEALRVAIGHAATAAASQNNESKPLELLPLPSFENSRSGDDDNNNDSSNNSNGSQDASTTTDGREEAKEVEDVVEGLELRALRLEHFMTVKARVGSDMAERLSPFLLSGSTELLTKILVFAAESAADAALAVPRPSDETFTTSFTTGTAAAAAAAADGEGLLATERRVASGPKESCSAGASRWGAGNMSDFRRRATGALLAAKSVADQRGMDPRDVESIIFRLAKGWICQQKPGGGRGGGGEGGEGGGVGGESMFIGAGPRGGGGFGESVFVRDAREERMMEDATLALRAAFVLTVTFSDDASDGDVDASVCDSIVYIDLKSRISVLLSIAKDGRKSVRSSRVKYRARFRALLAISALAPPTLVAEVMASDKEGWEPQGEGLSSLSDLRRNLGYMSELEEARLPHKLEELASCPAEDIVRALRRDHRGERSLIPLMCDMLLDAQSGDVGLWSPILADACRYDDLRRVLIMRVFPRVVRSTVADAFARSGVTLAASWEETLRAPLEELKSREDRQRRKKESAAAGKGTVATAPPAFPGASSTSFGASLFAITSSSNSSSSRGASSGGGRIGATTAGGGRGSGEQGHEDVMAVVEQVVVLLGACPFPERLDLQWFSSTLAGLGPSFHAQAVRVALGISGPAACTSAVLKLVEVEAVHVTVVLDELRPVAVGGEGSGGAWSGDGEVVANQAILEAVFLTIDERREWAELRGTRHFHSMVHTLVRAGRARGMVVSSLATGKHEEAYHLCQMHYAAAAAAAAATEVAANTVATVDKGGTGGVKKGAGVGDSGAPSNALARFAKEFGLQLPGA